METKINLASVAILFVVIVAIIVGLIGVAVASTSPWVLLVPMFVGVYAILNLYKV